jgi:hypothetical protein
VPESDDEISRLAVTLNDMLERLQAAFEHERRFVADASHELRTPLALLQTELDIALRRPRTHEELEKALRSAAEETQRLVRLAEDLLLIARADQGPLPISREEVDADDLLSDVASRFATRAQILGREVRVDDSGLRLDVDPLRVEQALANMLDNALVYGEGTVELRAVDAGDRIELHAVDEGRGFPEQFRERAFDRFSRADEARSRGGSGLGLSIVELVARAHGGDVGVKNRPRGGADVWLSLPRAPALKWRVHAGRLRPRAGPAIPSRGSAALGQISDISAPALLDGIRRRMPPLGAPAGPSSSRRSRGSPRNMDGAARLLLGAAGIEESFRRSRSASVVRVAAWDYEKKRHVPAICGRDEAWAASLGYAAWLGRAPPRLQPPFPRAADRAHAGVRRMPRPTTTVRRPPGRPRAGMRTAQARPTTRPQGKLVRSSPASGSR